nr:hypothetical protein [Tanacetum cinerariifolium]
MDLLAFIHVADPTNVRVVEREHAKGEVKLLDSTVGRVVPLLQVAPARVESELEASVNKLFDEGGSADQGNSATGDTAAVTAERPKRHPSSEVATGDKSSSVLIELLASSLFNVEAGVKAVATLPFVTSSVSATPKREDDNPTDSVTGANLRAIGPAERFVISLDSSHHSSTHATRAEVASIIRFAVLLPVKTEAVIIIATAGFPSAPIPETSAKVNTFVYAFMFHDSYSVGMVKQDVTRPSHLPGKELSLGSQEVDSEHLHEVFILRWNISNDALLDDLDTSREFVDHLAPSVLFSHIHDMDYEQVFTKFNVGTARQVCLNAEVRMRTEYCLSERKRLELKCVNQANLLKAKNDEIKRLKAQLLMKEAVAVETTSSFLGFRREGHEKIHADEIETLKQRNVAHETEKNSLDGKVTELQSSISTKDLELNDLNVVLSSLRYQNDGLVDQVAKLDANLAEMACHLEEKFYPHLLTTISGWREGGSLIDVATYNPSAEADFIYALQELREIDFLLLAELKSHKDASVEDIMNLLHLEGPLIDAPGMGDLQHDIEQLKVPIHKFTTPERDLLS